MKERTERSQISEEECSTLLIADDSEINRRLMYYMFAPFYPVEQAENGRVALEKILSCPRKYCAVLLDVLMPESNGMEVLHRLKREELLDKIPVFLITAEASDAVMREAYQLGVMDIIRKPVIPYMVVRRVSSIVELFQSRRRLNSVVHRQQEELLVQAEKIIDLNRG